LAASTPTLDFDEGRKANDERRTLPDAADSSFVVRPSSPRQRLTATRIGLAGLSLIAVVAFAAYAAFLASQADDVTDPVPITVPSKGAGNPLVGGNSAPNFTLPSIDGQPISLSDYAGRPVWINVWASWCAPCRAEMPDINAVYQDVRASQTAGDQGLALLTVSIGEEPGAVRKYLDSTKYDLTVLVDPTFNLTEQYRITGLPTHYFVGADGVIRALHIGPLKPAAMRTMLAKIATP
jgi:thiol-disulfide isomerase/thioredoxin